jgi:hypothetical protein
LVVKKGSMAFSRTSLGMPVPLTKEQAMDWLSEALDQSVLVWIVVKSEGKAKGKTPSDRIRRRKA